MISLPPGAAARRRGSRHRRGRRPARGPSGRAGAGGGRPSSARRAARPPGSRRAPDAQPAAALSQRSRARRVLPRDRSRCCRDRLAEVAAQRACRRRCAAAARRRAEVLGDLEAGEARAARGRAGPSAWRRRWSRRRDERDDRLAPSRRRGGRGPPASSTSGWASRTASTSAGATFSPPVTIVSALRPTMCRRPSSSKAPRSPVCSARAGVGRDGRAGDDDLAVGLPARRACRTAGRRAVATCEQASVRP